MNLTVTRKAEQFMLRMVRFGGKGAGGGFRLVVSPGGCSGLSAEFTVEGEPKAGDKVVELEGVKLFIPPESALLLGGYVVDFADTLTETGLKFHNPNARGVCGCGSGSGTPGNTDPTTATVSLAGIGRR